MKVMYVKGQYHGTGENILAVMPPPPADAPPAAATAWAMRAEANATGLCPSCGATVTVPNRHERRAAKATGQVIRAEMAHESWCPCSDGGIARVYIPATN